MLDDYAVVVGINNYPALGKLEGAEHDARAFRDWLLDPDGGDVPEANVQVILSSDYAPPALRENAHPAEQDVIDAFARLVEKGRRDGRLGRRLYIFMAGHGLGPDVHDAALFMANADDDLFIGYNVPGRPFATWFHASAWFSEVVLFMDCCRDNFANVPFRPPPFRKVQNDAAAHVRHCYGFATRYSRRSRERRMPNGEMRGVFSLALVEGLSGRALNGGQVTGSSLAAYASRRVGELLGPGVAQPVHFEVDATSPVVFLERQAACTTSVTVVFTPPAPESAVIFGPQFTLVAQVSNPQSDWTIRLPPGMYLAEASSQRRTRFEVVGEEALLVTL